MTVDAKARKTLLEQAQTFERDVPCLARQLARALMFDRVFSFRAETDDRLATVAARRAPAPALL